MPVSSDLPQWGVVGSLVAALLAVGRFLLRWERTFSEAARDELVVLREELAEVRKHVAQCEVDNRALRAEIDALRDRLTP